MSTVLSQSEIDELLSALNSGEEVKEEDTSQDNDNVRDYDFRTANKFNKEQMRTLDIIFETFSYLLGNRLTSIIHTLCEVEVLSIEEQKFGEYNNSLPTPSLIGIIDMEPLVGSILMSVSSTIAFAHICRVFGGVADYIAEDKSFTEIELVVNESVMHNIMGVLKESWENVIEVDPRLVRIETSSQFTQIAEQNEPSAIITLNVKIDKVEGMISICIPHYCIQPILSQLNAVTLTMAQNRGEKEIQDNKDHIEERLALTEVNISATFDDTKATLREILGLRVGDTIIIDHSINKFITVNVEHIPKLKGVIGVHKNKYVVQVAKTIKE